MKNRPRRKLQLKKRGDVLGRPALVGELWEPLLTHLARELAPLLADELAARAPAPAGRPGSSRLLTLDELVAELPAGKRPETWKRWLYERTRRGEVPGCFKIGGSLFFDLEEVHGWLETPAGGGVGTSVRGDRHDGSRDRASGRAALESPRPRRS